MARSTSFEYIPGKGFALGLARRYYNSDFYYLETDELIPSQEQEVVYLSRAMTNYLPWRLQEYCIKRNKDTEIKEAEKLLNVGKVRLLPPDKTSEITIGMTDPMRHSSGRGAGSQEILLTIDRRLDDYRTTCGCRDLYCRHRIAASLYLRKEADRLQELYLKSDKVTDKSYFQSEELITALDDCMVMDDGLMPEYIQKLHRAVNLITELHSVSYFGGTFNRLMDIQVDKWGTYDSRLMDCYLPLIGAFSMDRSISTMLESLPELEKEYLNEFPDRQYKSNLVFFKREYKHFQTARKDIEKGRLEPSVYKDILLKYEPDPHKLFQYYSLKKGFRTDDLEYLDMYAGDFAGEPEAVRAEILRKADEAIPICRDRGKTVISKLLSSYSPEERATEVAKMHNYTLDVEDFKALPMKLQRLLATDMPGTPEFIRYLLDKIAVGFDDKKMAAFILKMTANVPGGKDEPRSGELLYAVASRLDNNALLKLYIMERCSLRDKFPYQGSVYLTEEDITSYFDLTFRAEKDGDKIRMVYYVVPAGSGQIEAVDEGLAVLTFSRTDKAVTYGLGAEIFLAIPTVNMILDMAVRGREKEYEQQRALVQDEIDAESFEEEHGDFVKDYRKLCENLQTEKVVLGEAFRVNLSYMFNFDNDVPLLSFKAGNTREYIVKNGNDFIGAFRRGETVSYGKDLVLTHTLENLREEDIPVIRELMPLRFDVHGSGPAAKRFLPLSGAILSNVFEHLKGRMVTVDDEPCLIRLDPAELKLHINEKYELETGYDPDNQQILISGTRGYLYTYNTRGPATIDRIQADAEQIGLLDFVRANGEVSVKPIINDFRRKIYARFSDCIDVDEKIQKDFKLNTVRINAYFDYADKCITLKTEYYRDEDKVLRQAITDRADISKVGAFDDAITRLGFEDGILSDEGAILSFLKMDFAGLKKLASVYLSESLSNKKLVSVGRQVIKVNCSGSGIIDAVLEKSDFSEDELEEILQAMKRKKKFILLAGDRIIDLDSNEAKEFRDTVNDLKLEAGRLYKKKRLDMVGALKAFAHENNCSIDRHLRTMLEEIRAFKDYEAKTPKLNYEMRGYQEEGYRWLSVLSKYNMGGILADDMGLGKTLQVIALIKADTTRKPSLIVCPKSLVFNWINEFARFDGETPVTEIYGMADRRSEIIRGIDYGEKRVYVTSYDSLRNDIDEYTSQGKDFNYCILDEAQYIKNVTAQKSKSVKEIQAAHRFALTGTPIENNIIDLWSIFDFVMPGYFEELNEFRSAAGQEEFHEKVARRIGPFVLRRIKENVLSDLPPKYETILSCDMTVPQQKAYEALRKKTRDAMKADSKAFDLLPMLMQMRQVCVDPAMCIDNYSGGSGKMEMLGELIPRYLREGHRILLFSQFVKGLNQVERLLREQGIDYYMLTGDTPAKERSRMIDEYNSTNGTDVFLISLKAGGTGLNLTGADTVIHLDPWWNAAAENQATDRAHRIGQTRNVEVIKLISEGSIEQRVIELQNMKKDLIDKVISNDESSVTGASLEDIAYILN